MVSTTRCGRVDPGSIPGGGNKMQTTLQIFLPWHQKYKRINKYPILWYI